jgi:hypothetical protein
MYGLEGETVTDDQMQEHLAQQLLPGSLVTTAQAVLLIARDEGIDGMTWVVGLPLDSPPFIDEVPLPGNSRGLLVVHAIRAMSLEEFLPSKVASSLRHPSNRRW